MSGINDSNSTNEYDNAEVVIKSPDNTKTLDVVTRPDGKNAVPVQMEFNENGFGGRVELYDFETNSKFALAASGALEVGELIRLVGGNFETGALLAHKWSTNNVGSATSDAQLGELVLDTGVTANSIAEVQSVNRAIFTAATFNKSHMAVQNVNYSNADVVREWGMFDPVVTIRSGDGVFWRNDGGTLTLVRRKNGSDVEIVDEIDFNGPGTIVKDEVMRLYEIVYNAGVIFWYQDRKLIHKMVSLVNVAYETVHLPIAIRVENKNGNTTQNLIKTRGFACSRIGAPSSVPDRFLITQTSPNTGVIENQPGILDRIIIGDVGVGGAQVTLYDWDDTSPPASSKILTIDLTDTVQPIPIDAILNMGLVYVKSGSQFELLVITRG